MLIKYGPNRGQVACFKCKNHSVRPYSKMWTDGPHDRWHERAYCWACRDTGVFKPRKRFDWQGRRPNVLAHSPRYGRFYGGGPRRWYIRQRIKVQLRKALRELDDCPTCQIISSFYA